MNKLLFSATLAFVAIAIGFAQEVTKQVVNVEAFTAETTFTRNEVEAVRKNVIASLLATKRITVVDLEDEASIKAELERRHHEMAMADMREVKDIIRLNADFILKGNLNSLNTTQKTEKNYKGELQTYYQAQLSYTITLIDPATGATQNTYSYSFSAKSNDGANAARTAVINGSSANMKKFIEEAFPVRGTIVQVADLDSKKNVAKTVYINLGNDQGIGKGQKFVVYAVVDIAGEKSEKEIGTLTAVEVMSGTRTLCKVNNGGDEIAKNLASNAEMTIKSRARTGLFGD